jgi:hypothetical protein
MQNDDVHVELVDDNGGDTIATIDSSSTFNGPETCDMPTTIDQAELAKGFGFAMAAASVMGRMGPQDREKPRFLTAPQRRVELKPGERSVLQRIDRRGVMVVVGRVPGDGLTGSRRRAMRRAAREGAAS